MYAHWEASIYTITYDANGGSGSTDPQEANIGTNITLKARNTFIAPSGKHFSGWKDENGTLYKSGSTYKENKSITLYAQWEEHSDSCYDITYHSHTGNSTSGGGCYTIKHTSGGHCGGDAMWWCAYCGEKQGIGQRHGTNHKADCPYFGRSDHNGCDYHSTKEECGNWVNETITWSLGCGKSTTDVEKKTLKSDCGIN